AEKAIKAGAKFIVSPGFNEPVVDYCLERGVPVTPGVNSPSQIEQGLYKGLEVLKFFPAEASGGMAMLKAMSAPYNNLHFIPTGGIKTSNMHEYLGFSKVLAIGGSWMVKPEFIAEERFEEVTRLSREAVISMLGFSLQHIGINTGDEAAAKRAAALFATFFPGTPGQSEKSVMVGGAVELMKVPGRGTDGHIAIGTTNITRAAAFLERKGFAMDHQNAVEKDGRVKALFLKDEIAGFAVHLLER
ncbi:MAG TPA: bifunctional 4-hydroxy-2-oxoglutarate aldolase/2-dehydro-3-deoxy-phosphogluconate aldolase, partial [Clostridia bacterium]|nr:bifunctional 4-hydroxy-2-oxoglutarate aldolase/2-dehydro-3-deoxy-phosphogluconate aldolase [Clostridia bacterium]